MTEPFDSVIRPATRVNKISQPLEQPTKDEPVNCESCGDTKKVYGDPYGEKCPVCPEQPNTELLIVKTIQGLTSCINNELEKLRNITFNLSDQKAVLIVKALEEIDLFEKTTLFELQKAFE